MAKINVISPYFINVAATNLTSAKLEIIIYDGVANTSWAGSPQYTLTSTAINAKLTFEISELIKDYILAEFNGDYPTLNTSLTEATTRYVDYRITKSISGVAQTPDTPIYANKAFYGYGYFEDGPNPQFDQGYLQSNTTILKPDDAPARIAIDPTNITSVAFLHKGQQTYSFTPSGTYKIEDNIIYISNAAAAVDGYKDRVLLSSGTYEESLCINNFLKEFSVDTTDTIYVSGVEGVTAIKVNSISECKHTPYKLTFINKFGAYQNLWMFKRTNKTLTTSEEKFKKNIISDGSYATYNHQRLVLTKNGQESLVLNSGYYPESNNELFKQMLLSEKVWLEYEDKTLPVNIKSSNIAFKTNLNDKLIDYTVELDFAYETINNIR